MFYRFLYVYQAGYGWWYQMISPIVVTILEPMMTMMIPSDPEKKKILHEPQPPI